MTARLAFIAAAAALCAGCATTPSAPPPAPPGVVELLERPAERALVDGMRLYDEAQYPAAEVALRRALQQGLRSGRDQAAAYKLIAFVTCTSDRIANCEAAFRAARAADPTFALSRSEAGHPVWGPAYRRALP